ncbi:hypothetical protein [Streptomyces sp. NPDC051994]|uniref:hypothetical protein n=1 Tax=unclassified Streptomyces TaxID=2593676 RepID=UPI00342AA34A
MSFVSPAEVTSRVVTVWKSVAIFTETTATPAPTATVAAPSLVMAPPIPPILAVNDSPSVVAVRIPAVNGAVSARRMTKRSAISGIPYTALQSGSGKGDVRCGASPA